MEGVGNRVQAPLAPLFAITGAAGLLSGFNSGGSLMGSLVGARAFTPLGAAVVLCCGAAAGPWVVGTAVAHTIVFAVVRLPGLGPPVFLGALLGSLGTLALCYWRAVPTNSSVALVGGLAGAGLAAAGPRAVVWGQIALVFAGMVGAIAVGAAGGALAWKTLRAVLGRAREGVTPALRALQTVTALLQGFGYGSNDAARTIGLFALVAAWRSAAGRAALAAGHLPVPAWAVWAAIGTFGAGMALGGSRVAHTVGRGLYRVRAGDALAAQLAAGVTVIAAAAVGGPVSSTQTATAALLAGGAARRLSRPRWSLAAEMAAAWAITLPLSMALAAAAVALEAIR